MLKIKKILIKFELISRQFSLLSRILTFNNIYFKFTFYGSSYNK